MNSAEFFSNFQSMFPIILPVISGVILLLVSAWTPPHRRWLAPLWVALTLVVTLGLILWQGPADATAFDGMVVRDGFSLFLAAILLVSSLVAVGLSVDYFRCGGECRSEYFVLLLFSVSGMMLMAEALDLIIAFLALELLSLPLYVLVASACRQAEAEESSLKYFLMGAFSSGFVLYGVALIFGATGSTNIYALSEIFQSGAFSQPLLLIGAGMLLAGFSFKVGVVPFHMWVPDVYQGAPAPVTAFMSVGAKVAAFAALLRIFLIAFAAISAELASLVWMLAALSMLLGNLAAIPQSSLKRMLAYSSIAHGGYLMMPMVALGEQGRPLADAVASILFYLIVYALANLGAWAVVITLEKENGAAVEVYDLAGLARKSPFLAVCMAVFMLSLIGMPPLMGFVGKFYLFSSVVQVGQVSLALVGLLASLVSAVYYLRVIVVMYMRPGDPELHDTPFIRLTAGGMALGLLVFSIFATPIFNWLWRLVFGVQQ
jgi:NADH-quinone oxidoreductase subunit N